MAKPQPATWHVYKLSGKRRTLVGIYRVSTADEATRIAAEEHKIPAAQQFKLVAEKR